MAILAADLVKIQDLSKVTGYNFTDYYVPLGPTGTGAPVAILLDDLRSRVKSTVSTGSATYTANFVNHNHINLTISTDCAITVSNTPENSVNVLHIIKGSADTVTFPSGVTGTVDSLQTGKTTLSFWVLNINNNVYVIQINNQHGGSLDNTDITLAGETSSTFYYLEWKVNGNMCTLEGRLQLGWGISTTEITATLGAFVPTPANGYASFSVNSTNVSFTIDAILNSDVITFNIKDISSATGAGSAILYFSTTYEIEL